MRNLLIKMSFFGGNYHGWQIQKNALSIQEVFQNALYKILSDKPDIKGCSRTDTGVHAKMFAVSIKTENTISCNRLMLALNSYLPRDIAVYDISEVSEDFHARYSALSKTYEYHIQNSAVRNPFSDGLALHYRCPIDAELLNKAAKKYIGRHDFKSFCSTHSDKEDTVRTVFDASVHRDGKLIIFKISADGFLYNMVRIMTGTLLWVNEGRIDCEKIPDIINGRERSLSGKTAPPHGLYLMDVAYTRSS